VRSLVEKANLFIAKGGVNYECLNEESCSIIENNWTSQNERADQI
jgi:uncharacterized protein with ATP-grasp and redox domains